MLYEKLKNLLSEWDLYTSKEAEIPERIMKLEKWSIAKSVEITIAEMRSNVLWGRVYLPFLIKKFPKYTKLVCIFFLFLTNNKNEKFWKVVK